MRRSRRTRGWPAPERAVISEEFFIALVGRADGLEYRTPTDVYRFDVQLQGDVWTVHLPGSRGDDYATYELTIREASEILPRIERYLAEDRLFGMPVREYQVRFSAFPAAGEQAS